MSAIKYQNSPIGDIPNDWKLSHLYESAEILVSGVDKRIEKNEISVRLCNYTDVYYNELITDKIDFMNATAKKIEIEKYSLKKGDVVITKDSETPDDIAVSSFVSEDLKNVVCGYHLAIIRTDRESLLGEYLTVLFNLHKVKHYYYTLANGVTRFGLTLGAIKKSFVPIPPLKEQQRIANILTEWDKFIEKTDQLIEGKKKFKKGLIQKILSQRIRFKDDKRKDFPAWNRKRLCDFLIPTLRQIDKPKSKYLAIGIRSHCKGTFQKVDSDPSKIAMDKLFIVKEKDLIVNITFAWEGAIALVKKEDEGGLVSHRFPTYIFNRKQVLNEYFQYIFIQKHFRFMLEMISPGGAGRNRVMSKTDFLKLKLIFPCVEEQQKIADFLLAIDEEIKILEDYRDALKVQKKGLMQRLLTGKIRMKV